MYHDTSTKQQKARQDTASKGYDTLVMTEKQSGGGMSRCGRCWVR